MAKLWKAFQQCIARGAIVPASVILSATRGFKGQATVAELRKEIAKTWPRVATMQCSNQADCCAYTAAEEMMRGTWLLGKCMKNCTDEECACFPEHQKDREVLKNCANKWTWLDDATRNGLSKQH